MLDIGPILKSLRPGETRAKIDDIQEKGRRLAIRILGTFTLEGHRAIQIKAKNGLDYHALIHNEADDPTDYLVVHLVGENEHLFDCANIDDEWIINYLDMDHYDALMEAIGEELLEYANRTYADYVLRNFGEEPPPLTEESIDLEAFAEDLSHKDLSLSHAGNMRLAF